MTERAAGVRLLKSETSNVTFQRPNVIPGMTRRVHEVTGKGYGKKIIIPRGRRCVDGSLCTLDDKRTVCNSLESPRWRNFGSLERLTSTTVVYVKEKEFCFSFGITLSIFH